MPESPIADRMAFTLSQEELYVLLTYLKVPAPFELEGLDGRVLAGLASDQRAVLLRAVGRGLIAREYLRFDKDRALSVNPGIARLVETCAVPEQSWAVLHRPRARAATTLSFHRRAGLFVSLSTPFDGIHRLVAFVDEQVMAQAISDLVAVGEAKAVACDPGALPMTVLGLLASNSQALDAAATAARLVEAGLSADTAAGLARGLEGMRSLTVLTRATRTPGAKPRLEANVTVVADGSTLWLLSQESPESLSVRSGSGEDLTAIIRSVIGTPRPAEAS